MSALASASPAGAPPLFCAKLLATALAAVLALGAPAQARADELADLINAYRAAPATCGGHAARPVAPLPAEPALSSFWIGPATFLESVLTGLGYASDRAEAISVSGPPDARAAMAVIEEKYCAKLLSDEFSAIGTARRGTEWQVVLAHRIDLPVLPAQEQTGQQILYLVNAARARPRACGDQRFAAAAPLRWNPALAEAALAHSSELATHHYFSHKERDGSVPADRVARAGYAWSRVGENIASGQRSAVEAVQGWLDSPGHCGNIMNPGFTEMGAAYAINPHNDKHTVYWTQEFARPR